MPEFSPDESALFSGTGPFWYRCYHYGTEGRYTMASVEEVEALLEFYGVDRMVVGHAEVNGITPLHNGRIIAIDATVEELGGQQALLIEGGRLYSVDHDGALRNLP
ncbi:MAG: hypothetical protein AVO35_12100 [Candidatus Aegiribacteria sp. MLS_C]|nr:MAG: hypothetical protein AVO35_12100 [Candidatus Aegiribacteria sp. MLS_C]